MKYHQLPLITVSASLNKDTVFPMLQSYAPFLSDFLLDELTKMLTGSYALEGSIAVLPNLMLNTADAARLMHVQAFMIFDARYGYYTKRDGLDSHELRYTLSGEGTLEYEGRTYTLKPGDGYFISCRKPHTYYAGKQGWKSTVLHINGGLCAEFFEKFAAGGQVCFSSQSISSFEVMQLQVLQATQKITPYQSYRVNCLLDLLLTELLTTDVYMSAPESDNSSEIIAAILDYIHVHYAEEITFEKLAKMFGISRTLLFAEFKRCTGCTPAAYLIKVRIRQAKLLLTSTRESIEVVSAKVGFRDAGHFSQMFKKEVGTTPLKYRKSASLY